MHQKIRIVEKSTALEKSFCEVHSWLPTDIKSHDMVGLTFANELRRGSDRDFPGDKDRSPQIGSLIQA